MEILNMKRHGHEIITTECSERQRILSQRLHVFTDRFREKSETAEPREESQQRYNERTGR